MCELAYFAWSVTDDHVSHANSPKPTRSKVKIMAAETQRAQPCRSNQSTTGFSVTARSTVTMRTRTS